jgi:hypothetical protein
MTTKKNVQHADARRTVIAKVTPKLHKCMKLFATSRDLSINALVQHAVIVYIRLRDKSTHPALKIMANDALAGAL